MTNSVVFTEHIHEYMIWLAIEYFSKYRCDTLNFDHIDAHTEHSATATATATTKSIQTPQYYTFHLFFFVGWWTIFSWLSLSLSMCVHVFFILFVISFFVTFDYQWFMSFASSQLNAFHSIPCAGVCEHIYIFTFTNRKIAKE